MQLNEQQTKAVKSWIELGDGLSEVQRKLRAEYGISMTFMDVRLLMLDMNVTVKDKVAPKKEVIVPAQKSGEETTAADEPDIMPENEEEGTAGGVSLTLDRLIKPGTIVSGTVRFSDGVSASWGLDQMGRLMLNPEKQNYKPSQEDVRGFQVELQKLLAQRGF